MYQALCFPRIGVQGSRYEIPEVFVRSWRSHQENPGGVHNGDGMPRERRGLGHALVTVATGQEPKTKPVKCLGSMVPCPNPMLL